MHHTTAARVRPPSGDRPHGPPQLRLRPSGASPLFHDDQRRFEPFPEFRDAPRAYVDALSPRERRQFRRACPDRITDAALADPDWQQAIRCGCAVARGEEEAAATACARDEE